MTSTVNGKRFFHGRLETPSLAELRERIRRVSQEKKQKGRLTLSEVVANVQDLHLNPGNTGALFQVASQFNLLEMVGPSRTPEDGVTDYAKDHTQGPACAIACGAGTIYRNYFAPVNGRLGQSHDNQIDCLRDVGDALDNSAERLWTMRNGYALATEEGLSEIDERLSSSDESELDRLREKLRIGLHWNTEVTLSGASHAVSQAYCSALPVAYSPHAAELWQGYARLVLEASYEAVLAAATWNVATSASNKVFLTVLGGGAFGNPIEWILPAMVRALRRFSDVDLDVAIVSYGSSNAQVRKAIAAWDTERDDI
jgi:hypothetical protein